MADELDIDLDQLDENINKTNRVEQRLKDLSEKVRNTAQERDSLTEATKTLQVERDDALKERDFYAKFSDSTAKYAGAHEFKDKIREKVMAGYDVEDATVAVLAKEGKLSQPTQVVEKDTVAGGSSATAMSGGGQKTLSEMTRDEKRAKLVEAEAKGDISV